MNLRFGFHFSTPFCIEFWGKLASGPFSLRMVVLDSVLHLWASHLFDWYWNWFLDLDVLGFSQGASWLYLLYFLSKLGPAGSVYILGGNSVWGPFTWKRLQYLCWVKVLFIYLIWNSSAEINYWQYSSRLLPALWRKLQKEGQKGFL